VSEHRMTKEMAPVSNLKLSLVALAVATADLALWRKLRQSRGLTLLLLRVFHKDEGSTRSAVASAANSRANASAMRSPSSPSA